eukprot:TRINITY_DN1033_c0_g1_i2.p1 TRINITY_DN1033_c0_g1~~TRINITY_DN1033_c0_g1_i2.p1  ORF type:complete len:602 (-),score=122.47 TRINITY_DN1033_c0_g1_i2:141-1946(-)
MYSNAPNERDAPGYPPNPRDNGYRSPYEPDREWNFRMRDSREENEYPRYPRSKREWNDREYRPEVAPSPKRRKLGRDDNDAAGGPYHPKPSMEYDSRYPPYRNGSRSPSPPPSEKRYSRDYYNYYPREREPEYPNPRGGSFYSRDPMHYPPRGGFGGRPWKPRDRGMDYPPNYRPQQPHHYDRDREYEGPQREYDRDAYEGHPPRFRDTRSERGGAYYGREGRGREDPHGARSSSRSDYDRERDGRERPYHRDRDAGNLDRRRPPPREIYERGRSTKSRSKSRSKSRDTSRSRSSSRSSSRSVSRSRSPERKVGGETYSPGRDAEEEDEPKAAISQNDKKAAPVQSETSPARSGPTSAISEPKNAEPPAPSPAPRRRLGWGQGLVAFEKKTKEPDTPAEIKKEDGAPAISPASSESADGSAQVLNVFKSDSSAMDADAPRDFSAENSSANEAEATPMSVEPPKSEREAPKQAAEVLPSKEEVLTSIEKLDAEITKTESMIGYLKRPKKTEHKHLNVLSHDVIQMIYDDNRQTVAQVVEEQPAILQHPTLKNSTGPLYRKPSDLPFYNENIANNARIKNKVAEIIAARTAAVKEREQTIKER